MMLMQVRHRGITKTQNLEWNNILPETNSSHLKRMVGRQTFPFGVLKGLFSGAKLAASFREGRVEIETSSFH